MRKLAYSVHHKGRTYPMGATAAELGDVAKEFGDHVWEGAEERQIAGVMLGSKRVPHPSGLPGGPAQTNPADVVPEPADDASAKPAPATEPDADAAAAGTGEGQGEDDKAVAEGTTAGRSRRTRA